MFTTVPLSRIEADRRNSRRVKPEREAHKRLLASIRAHGLLEPLVVRPNGRNIFHVVAGRRRLEALREIHRGKDAKVYCQVVKVDGDTAEAMSLAENFAREAMHPLDEAESFARLAQADGKTADAIAAEFGVSERYVRQRMKLSTLAEPVRKAYRADEIDTGTAEAFAAVPSERQIELWKETGGHPRHAQHVRNLIEHAWIDANHALFDVGKLPDGAVSRDLFCDRVLVERQAFMTAQTQALEAQRTGLTEDGWGEVVVAARDQVQDRLWSMPQAEPEYAPETMRKLEKFAQRREKLEAKLNEADGEEAVQAIYERIESLDAEQTAVIESATITYAEPTKAVGTVFLILDPDGQVRREYRVPKAAGKGSRSNGSAGGGALPPETPVAPTSDDLSDGQKGTVFTHEALAVREALLADERMLRVMLAIILHEKVTKEALAIRHDVNGTKLYASEAEGFTSKALDTLRERRTSCDPLGESHPIDEAEAFEAISALRKPKLDTLIDLLIVDCLTAHLRRPTPLVRLLVGRLGVNIRKHWRPDGGWLNGYKKIQLAELLTKLRGPTPDATAQQSKKSELVAELDKLFADASEGRVNDSQLAEKVNAWAPAQGR